MITPGFFSFFNAQRGLIVAQNALSTVNQNISNANTPGYSRQRVEITTYNPYTNPSIAQVADGGQLGQGPWVSQVTRSRDRFLDAQFRQSNGFQGLDTALRDALQQVESIVNEPSTSGVNSVLQNFFDTAQELSIHPESIAVRTQFLQQATDLVTVFQQQARQLSDLRKSMVGDPLDANSFATSQLAITATDINTKLASLADLNRNIVVVKASGAQPNDLLDQRDKLLDDLSQLADIQVTTYDNGQIDVLIAGQAMIRGVDRVDSLEVVANPGPAPTADDVPSLIRTVNGGVVLNDGAGAELGAGRLKGISDMGGNATGLSTVRGVLGKLDNLLGTVVAQVNTLQAAGRDFNGAMGVNPVFQNDPLLNPGQPLNIFHWKVNATLVGDPKLLAAALNDATMPGNFAGQGDGRNALAMAQLRDQSFVALGSNLVDYLNGIVSKLGVDTRSYEDSSTAQDNLVHSLDLQRQSVSGVNIDEETIDLLRYQRAYEATSKVISTLDQITQTIINLL
jgi:flagellar hook-associated protein 1 FlgK